MNASPNFAYLENHWLKNTGAQRAFGYRRNRSEDELRWLLRHHDEESVYEPDTDYRDDFDRLLMFYNLVEIGLMIGFVTSDLPDNVRRKHLSMLADPAVRNYYEWNYPLDLPRRLRERLQNDHGYSVERTPLVTSTFYEFLELTKHLERDEDIEMFLWALDDGKTAYDISDVRTGLKSPKRLLNAVVRKRALRTDLDRALTGFCKFISWCEAFESLLKRTEQAPLLAEAMWLTHAYWFRQFASNIGTDVKSVLRTIALWQVTQKSTRPIQKRLSSLDRTINFLATPPLSRNPLHSRKAK
jgi:hypothetical protein